MMAQIDTVGVEVASRAITWSQLYYWLKRQKYAYAEGRLSEKVVLALNRMGFDWNLCQNITWRPFTEAREYVVILGLKNLGEWYEYCKSGDKPKDIPASPWLVYKGKGWIDCGHWLGTGFVANYNRKYRPFKRAKKYVVGLGMKNLGEWYEYCKSGDKPKDIPASPSHFYKGKGWIGWGDWLGTGNIAPRNKKFRPFAETRKYVARLGFKNSREWREYSKSSKRPKDIPASPESFYKGKGWIDWDYWLGDGRGAKR
jgi:hypothetical protein